MNTEYVFEDDARKRKRILLLISILGSLGFVTFMIYEIITYFSEPGQKIASDNPLMGIASCGLLGGVVIPIFLRNKYFKSYMFITKTDMKFYLGATENKYLVTEFCGYEIVWKRTLYTNYRLVFTDGKAYYFISSKPPKFQALLNKLLEDNRRKQNIKANTNNGNAYYTLDHK